MARNSKERVENWFEHGIDLETRTIYIGDYEDTVIGADIAMCVVKAFHLFNTSSVDKPVTVYLNTTGGEWYYGTAIYDTIMAAQSEVSIFGVGCVMSMGSIIMQAAEHRYMYPNATMMIHDGTAGYETDSRSSINWSKNEERILNVMYKIYASRSNHPVSYWKRLCSHDTILSAQQAKKLGLIDYIVGEDDEL